jgi:hypothetical protein
MEWLWSCSHTLHRASGGAPQCSRLVTKLRACNAFVSGQDECWPWAVLHVIGLCRRRPPCCCSCHARIINQHFSQCEDQRGYHAMENAPSLVKHAHAALRVPRKISGSAVVWSSATPPTLRAGVHGTVATGRRAVARRTWLYSCTVARTTHLQPRGSQEPYVQHYELRTLVNTPCSPAQTKHRRWRAQWVGVPPHRRRTLERRSFRRRCRSACYGFWRQPICATWPPARVSAAGV